MTNTMWMRGVEWLAAAAADPRACKWEWDHGEGIALLEAGRFWDVLSVPERLGLLTLDLLWRPGLPVPGPTLVDTKAGRVGFLLPPDGDPSRDPARGHLPARGAALGGAPARAAPDA
ncbi:hypothetical protein ACWCRI_39465, partial [Streptomyces collinus]